MNKKVTFLIAGLILLAFEIACVVLEMAVSAHVFMVGAILSFATSISAKNKS